MLLIGRVLGVAASKYQNLYVTCSEAYVAETRGGDSRVDIIIATSEEELDYIKVRKADIALFLHQDQLTRFSNLVGNSATVFVDSSLVKELPGQCEWKIFKAPYTELAESTFRTPRVANMIALGHLVGTSKLVSEGSVEKAIDELVKGEWRDLNITAYNLGLRIQGT